MSEGKTSVPATVMWGCPICSKSIPYGQNCPFWPKRDESVQQPCPEWANANTTGKVYLNNIGIAAREEKGIGISEIADEGGL